MAAFWYRVLTWAHLRHALIATAVISSAIYLLIAMANIAAFVFALDSLRLGLPLSAQDVASSFKIGRTKAYAIVAEARAAEPMVEALLEPATKPPEVVTQTVPRKVVFGGGTPFVYFIQAGDGGPIKIGVSLNPGGRMASM